MTIDSSLDTGTWRFQMGLAYWVFELPSKTGTSPDHQLLDCLRIIGGILEGFAEVRNIEWRTREAGEDALVEHFDDNHRAAGISLVGGGSSLRDITSVNVDLDLICLGLDGKRRRLPEGADLSLEWEDVSGLDATFGLNTDIFVARTWADDRDNRPLATLNAPRLNGFLQRVESELGGRLRSFDPSDYVGQYVASGVLLSSLNQ